MLSITSILRKVDWYLLLPAVILTLMGISVLVNFSSNNFFATHQLLWLMISILIFLVLSKVDFNILKNSRLLLLVFFVVVIALIAVFFLGGSVKGAQSRFYIFGLAIQPSDPAALVLITVLSKYFSRRHMQIAQIKHILISGVYALILFVLVAVQPDLGSALMIASVWFFIVLLSGISKKHLFALIFLVILFAGTSWLFILKPYQKDRILIFLDPLKDLYGAGYNAYQSLVAVGSGGLLGKGIGAGTQSKLSFLPEYQTDFIFAAFAEEWGFFGAIILLSLFFALLFRIIYIGIKASDNFVRLFSVGSVALILTHVTVNIGMNIGLLPITGITLPFFSYGGSHLLTEFALLGFLSSMSRHFR